MKYTFFFCLFFINSIIAQDPLFVKMVGFNNISLRVSAIVPDEHGNFYVVAQAAYDFTLFKFDEKGTALWQKTYDIKGEEDDPRAIFVDSDENIVIVGRTHQNDDKQQQGFILKIDPNTQEILWSVLDKAGTFYSSIVEYHKEYIVGGNEYFSSNIDHGDDALLHTINKTTGRITAQNFGFDLGHSASEDYDKLLIDNNLLYAWGRFTFLQGYEYMRGTMQVFDLKNFNLLRTTAYVKRPTEDNARLYGTSFIIDDNSIVAAQYGQLNGIDLERNTSVVLTKTAKNGKLEWTKSYQFDYATEGAEIINADDGYYILTANKYPIGFFSVIKTNKSGTILWSKKINRSANSKEFSPYHSLGVKGFWNKQKQCLYMVGHCESNRSGSVLLVLNCDKNGNIANDDKQCELGFERVNAKVLNLSNVQFSANPKRYQHKFQTVPQEMAQQIDNNDIFYQKTPCEKQITDIQPVTKLPKDTTAQIVPTLATTLPKDTLVQTSSILAINPPSDKYDFSTAKPINLFLLLDISGSMRKNIDSLKQVLSVLIPHLRPQDYISIVTFSEGNAIKLLPTSCANKSLIINVLNELKASGNTYFDAALLKLYEATALHYSPDYNNQIIIVSDGIFTINKSSYLSIKSNSTRFATNAIAFDAPPIYQKQFQQITRFGAGQFFEAKPNNIERYLLEILKK